MNKNQRKADVLGMPWGTAQNKLRKIVLFDCVRRLGEDDCYRCGEKIEDIEQFSIEHKKAWINVDPALFWDLDNISFSHLECNQRAGGSSGGKVVGGWNRIVSPDGMSWCCICRTHKPAERFCRDRGKNGRNGLNKECRDCRKLR